MSASSVFVFDSSYPTIDVALPLDELVPHVFVSSRLIEPPPEHTSLLIQEEKSLGQFIGNIRNLQKAWKSANGRRCIVIAAPGMRPGQLFIQTVYATLLTRDVSLFDGICFRALGSMKMTVLRAGAIGLLRYLFSGVKQRVAVIRFNMRVRYLSGSSTPEGRLFGLYTASRSFSLPKDLVVPQQDVRGVYGEASRGWYFSAFSSRRQRFIVKTTRHSLGKVALHVEVEESGEMSALLRDQKILDYPYMLGRTRPSDRYAISTRRTVTKVRRGICLLAYATGYYHWLIEGIPRILDVLDDGFDFDEYPLILPSLTDFQRQFLELFGIDPDRQVISLSEGDWCHVDDCIFPTAYFPFGALQLEDPSGQPDRSLLLRLRERILERLSFGDKQFPTPRRLYISRAQAHKRKFMDHIESRVVAILEAADFVTVHLEQLPWIEQVRLLSEAEYVVGLHGAGLSNLVFSQAKALLEFHHPMETRPYFALITRELGIRYYYLMGSLEGDSPQFDNITIDLDLLPGVLKKMLDGDSTQMSTAEGSSTGPRDQGRESRLVL